MTFLDGRFLSVKTNESREVPTRELREEEFAKISDNEMLTRMTHC